MREVFIQLGSPKYAGFVLSPLLTQARSFDLLSFSVKNGFEDWLAPFVELLTQQGIQVRLLSHQPEYLDSGFVHYGKMFAWAISQFVGDRVCLMDDDNVLGEGSLSVLFNATGPILPTLRQSVRMKPARNEESIRHLIGETEIAPDEPHYPIYGLTADKEDWHRCLDFLPSLPWFNDAAITSYLKPKVSRLAEVFMIVEPASVEKYQSLFHSVVREHHIVETVVKKSLLQSLIALKQRKRD